jgi:hypothetical protein
MLAHARGGGGFFNKGKTSGSRLIKKYWGENVIKKQTNSSQNMRMQLDKATNSHHLQPTNTLNLRQV